MPVHIYKSAEAMGAAEGAQAAGLIKEAISEKGEAIIILATGASQFDTLKVLVSDKAIEWNKVTMFHLDEYIGLSDKHRASFRKYLKERFLDKIPALKAAWLINGENEPGAECKRMSDVISQHTIDVALVGIGENGHLAFNDPPADFETEVPYMVVTLDEKCRNQQLNEGWFDSIGEVPSKAISMSIRQITQSKHIICSVPEKRKAEAVRNALRERVSPLFPASILQNHPSCDIYLDEEAASLLNT